MTISTYKKIKRNNRNLIIARHVIIALHAGVERVLFQNRVWWNFRSSSCNSKTGFLDGWNSAGMITIAALSGRVSAVFWSEVICSCFFSDRSDVELQAADLGDGGPAREGAPRHEEEGLRRWEMEWLWGQSWVWRIHWRCCKEVNSF